MMMVMALKVMSFEWKQWILNRNPPKIQFVIRKQHRPSLLASYPEGWTIHTRDSADLTCEWWNGRELSIIIYHHYNHHCQHRHHRHHHHHCAENYCWSMNEMGLPINGQPPSLDSTLSSASQSPSTSSSSSLSSWTLLSLSSSVPPSISRPLSLF